MHSGAASRLALAVSLAIAASCSGPHGTQRRPVTDAGTRPAATIARAVDTAAPDAATPTGSTLLLRPRSAPFRTHPDTLVHVPPGFVREVRIDLAVFLHGWRGCVAVVASSQNAPCTPGGPVRFAMDVVAQFDRSGANAILMIPQLAFDADSSAAGRLGTPGGLRALIDEVLSDERVASAIGGSASARDLGRVALIPHSGAYLPAALALRMGGVDVTDVLLLDALYRDMPEFEAWVRVHPRDFADAMVGARRLAMVYSDAEGTGPTTRALFRRCVRDLPVAFRSNAGLDLTSGNPPPEDAFRQRLLACRTVVRHEDIPRVFLAPLLEAWSRAPTATTDGD